MTKYRFHWLPASTGAAPMPSIAIDAESTFHGAALALRDFMQRGCDLSAPLAHLDITAADGTTHTLLVEEVLDWLGAVEQAAFVQREGLTGLRDRLVQ